LTEAPVKVALVGLDGLTPPDWVGERFAAAGVTFVAKECNGRSDLEKIAGDADILWVFGSHRCLYADNLDVLPRCGAIIRTGSGTDNVPVAEATARGIVVANTPDALTEAVSDHAIGLLFAVIRRIAVQDAAVRRGVWDRTVAWPDWHVHGQTLGLVGFGRVARRVARKLSGFDLAMLAFDPYAVPADFETLQVRSVDLDTLLVESDFVFVHCPLTPATFHVIDEQRLRRMRAHAVLVNTSRGSVVDEQALVRALREGWIGGAGLDVLEQEPPALDNPLLTLPNTVLTPHISGYSDEYLVRSWQLSVETALDLARGEWPRSCVNREVQPRWTLTENHAARG
jgi:D-3-phosphoglycerate dehydrogenase